MNVKSIFLASAAIAGIPIAVASASDLQPPPARMPVKAAPYVVPPFNWTGFYIGANAGGVWAKGTVEETDVGGAGVLPDSITKSGLIAGVQVGYNWQVSNIVVGVEGDFDFSSASKSSQYTAFDLHNTRLSSLGTARARVGVTFDRWLPYITGGVAFASLKNELVDTGGVGATMSRGNSATGWTVGGGLEYGIDNHWSAKIEYLYAKFPDKTDSSQAPYIFKFTDSLSVARVGINYRF
ncbi:MAG TPA: outer membrane protein [Pseudolabrys sp.]